MIIGFLANNLDLGGGGGRYASDLINGVKKMGHQAIMLTDFGDKGPNPILKRGTGILSSSLKAMSLLKNCDLIHALDGYPYGVIGAIVNNFLDKRLVITLQGTYSVAPLYNLGTASLTRWSYRQADALIAISSYTRDEVFKKIKLENVNIINHGLNFNNFFQEHELSSENFILSVGGAKERKGYHVSIPAFAKIAKKFSDYKYYIVADNGSKYLSGIAEREGVADKVIFLEDITDEQLLALYRKAKLFILVPICTADHHIEGFGLAYLEAAAAGTPVIGTFGTGAEDAIANNKNGILVQQNDIQGTSDSISKILSDQTLWNKMSEESHHWAGSHKIEDVVQNYINLYERIL